VACKLFKDKIKTGSSFPFIENKDGNVSLRYDSVRVSIINGQVTMTFIQDNVPIYAYTYDVCWEHAVTFTGMSGKIDIEIK